MRKILDKKFFENKTLTVAKNLLGKYLVVKNGGKISAFKITEVEAYDGPLDRASHASRGRTKRTELMFGEAGVFYVYFIYGMYWMLNVVTGKKDYPAAILIRGIEQFPGPGKLTKALEITRKFNGLPAIRKTGLWFEDRGEQISKKDILMKPRIGVNYAGPIWSQKLYRFFLQNNKTQVK